MVRALYCNERLWVRILPPQQKETAMIGKTFIYKTPYGGIVRGVIKSLHARTDLTASYKYVVSENGNLYRVDEIEIESSD